MNGKELQRDRILLAVAGSVYLIWWKLVQVTLPDSFNPLPGRLAVVLLFYFLLGASLLWKPHSARFASFGVAFGSCVLTLHYFYLFHHNAADLRWIIGCYITVAATSMCQFSRPAIWAYSVLTLMLGALLTAIHPLLQHSIFFAGLLTIVALNCLGILLRMKTQRRLTEASQRFESLFNATFEGVALHHNGLILDTNHAFAEIFGYSQSEMIGRSIYDNMDQGLHQITRQRIEHQSEEVYENLGIRKDGSRITIEARGKTFLQNGVPLRLVAVRDVTDRKKAEEEHVIAQAAQKSIQIRDEFISTASHELKTPLTAAKLSMQLLSRKIARGEPQATDPAYLSKVLRDLDRHCDRLSHLVEDMLDVSRISSGRMLIRKEPVDLAAIARESIASLELEMSRSGSQLTIHADRPVPTQADRFRVEQVVINLLTNASKYGAGKPIDVHVLTLPDGRACFKIEDHGIGIPAEQIQSVFNRFERAASSRNISGLGLGLYISKQIIDSHGGEIFAERLPEGGTRFTFILPNPTAPVTKEQNG